VIIIYDSNGNMISSRTSAQYNGDKFPGQNSRWVTFDTDANAFVRYSYDELANRCAALYHTCGIARACVNKPFVYAIGDGLIFRSAIDADFLQMGADEAKEWSRRFTELVHLEKIETNYYEKTGLLYKEASITGDALLYFLREANDEKPFDLIAAGGHTINPDANSKGYSLGVRIDDYSRRLGVQTREGKEISFKDIDGNQSAVMFMLKERPGQIRGMSRFYSEIGRAKSFDRMWDATVERMVQEAVQLGYYNVTSSDPQAQADAMARAAAGKSRGDDLEKVAGETALTPGAMYTFGNKEGMTFNDLKIPSNNFGLGNEWTVNMFAMATGYAPEFILSKYSTSYTAHKDALNDTYKKITQERMSFIRNVEFVINLEYLKHFARTGQISVPVRFWEDYKIRRAMTAGSYLGVVPGHINPFQEVRADVAAEDAGYTSKEAIASKYVNDFWPMIDEMHAQRGAWERMTPDRQADQLAGDSEARDKDGRIDKEGRGTPANPGAAFLLLRREDENQLCDGTASIEKILEFPSIRSRVMTRPPNGFGLMPGSCISGEISIMSVSVREPFKSYSYVA